MVTRSIPPLFATPRVRGRYMQTFVAYVERLPSADRDCVHSRVPEEVWREIGASGTFTWLPFGWNLTCTRAVAQCLGPRRTEDFFRTLMFETFKTPLLQSLVNAVLRMRGNDPSVTLPWVSKGFELMFKDVGTWQVDQQEPRAASLVAERLPPAAVEDRIWLESVASSLSALFDLSEVQGVVTIRSVEARTGTVVFRLRWEKV